MSVDISIDFGARLGGVTLADFGRFRGDAADAMTAARWRVQEDILNLWPVDTGTSLQAWENYIDGTRWVLRNAVEYAEWVFEAGTYSGPESTVRIADVIEANAEIYAADALTELRGLLAQARREERPQIGLFTARGVQRPSVRQVIGARVFQALQRSFQQPGRGARQRLRERFPDQPIGRATSRRRTRERVR